MNDLNNADELFEQRRKRLVESMKLASERSAQNIEMGAVIRRLTERIDTLEKEAETLRNEKKELKYDLLIHSGIHTGDTNHIARLMRIFKANEEVISEQKEKIDILTARVWDAESMNIRIGEIVDRTNEWCKSHEMDNIAEITAQIPIGSVIMKDGTAAALIEAGETIIELHNAIKMIPDNFFAVLNERDLIIKLNNETIKNLRANVKKQSKHLKYWEAIYDDAHEYINEYQQKIFDSNKKLSDNVKELKVGNQAKSEYIDELRSHIADCENVLNNRDMTIEHLVFREKALKEKIGKINEIILRRPTDILERITAAIKGKPYEPEFGERVYIRIVDDNSVDVLISYPSYTVGNENGMKYAIEAIKDKLYNDWSGKY